jgi:type IV fimbrial biogenesis protein FimT
VISDKSIDARRGKFAAPASQAFRAKNGFTLIELIVALAIVAIVAAFAIPSFSTNSPSAEANELLGAMQFARFSAIKNGQYVVVCPLASGSTTKCGTGTAWNAGVLIFVAASNGCGATGSETGDVVLKTIPAFSNTDTAAFTAGNGGSNTSMCVTRSGFVPASSTGKVTFQTKQAQAKQTRCMVVSGVGHMQVISNGQTDVSGVQCP